MKLLTKRWYVRHISLAFAVAALLAPAAMNAQAPGKHPAYLHAMADLRYARGYLTQLGPNDKVDNYSSAAVHDIDAAISELKRASIDDGKNVNDHPPIDANLKKTDRFHKASELLDQALADVQKEEDDSATLGLRKRIIDHIDAAHDAVKRAMAAMK
jgi:hypothetical protein